MSPHDWSVMEVFDSEPGFGHERVTLFTDRDTGLKAIVAIHDTTLGLSLIHI